MVKFQSRDPEGEASEARRSPSDPVYGAGSLLRQGGGGIYLEPGRFGSGLREIREHIGRLGGLSRIVSYDLNSVNAEPPIEDSVRNSLEQLRPTDVLLGFGVNYNISIDGFPLVVILRTPDDFAELTRGGE